MGRGGGGARGVGLPRPIQKCGPGLTQQTQGHGWVGGCGAQRCPLGSAPLTNLQSRTQAETCTHTQSYCKGALTPMGSGSGWGRGGGKGPGSGQATSSHTQAAEEQSQEQRNQPSQTPLPRPHRLTPQPQRNGLHHTLPHLSLSHHTHYCLGAPTCTSLAVTDGKRTMYGSWDTSFFLAAMPSATSLMTTTTGGSTRGRAPPSSAMASRPDALLLARSITAARDFLECTWSRER